MNKVKLYKLFTRTRSTGTTSICEFNIIDGKCGSDPFHVSQTVNPGGGWK